MTIHSLPVEILCHIFHLLQPIYPVFPSEETTELEEKLFACKLNQTRLDSNIMQIMLGWINVTFVSRRWRGAALSDSGLWARVPFVLGRDWTNTFIKRSQSIPLDIQVGHPTLCDIAMPNISWAKQLLLEKATQIRGLTVYYEVEDAPRESDMFYTIIKHMSKQLETLELHRSWTSIGSSWLTVQQHPRLHSLTLGLPNVKPDDVPWDDIGALQLTEFCIQFVIHPLTAPTFPRFLRALTKLGSLKILTILCDYDKIWPQDQDPRCVCNSDLISPHFPSLKLLELDMSSSTVFHILQHIEFPASTSVNLGLAPAFDHAAYNSTFVPMLSSMFDHEPYQQMVLSDDDNVTDFPWRLAAARPTGLILQDPCLVLKLHDEGFVSCLDTLTTFGRDALRSLSICVWPRLLNDAMISKLFLLHKLSYINVSLACKDLDVESANLLATLLQKLLAPHAVEGVSITLPFPELQVLDLRDVRSINAPSALSWALVDPVQTFSSTLADISKTRCEWGAPVLRIHLAKYLEEAFVDPVEGLEFFQATPGVESVSARIMNARRPSDGW